MIENVHNENLDSAIARAITFENELERLVKRYLPINFAPLAASTLLGVLSNQNQWGTYPPHIIVKSIEANCAYFRNYRTAVLDERRFNEIISLQTDYYDPYLRYVLQDLQDLDLFALAMSREQFELQHTPTLDLFARSIILYSDSPQLSRSRELFEARTQITISDWIFLCFIITSVVYGHDVSIFHLRNILESDIKSMPRAAAPYFLECASATPSQIGTLYKNIRQRHSPHLHIFLKSSFFSKPLLNIGEDNYLVVHPYLIFNHADQGIYDICISEFQDVFSNEFGASFEKYVGELLGEFYSPDSIINEGKMADLIEGRVCDYVIELSDCILLVECKATKYSADLLTENAILHDNSTGKIANAFEQIRNTGARIVDSQLDLLICDNSKPLVAISVFYGDLYFANSDGYFERFIRNRMDPDFLGDWPEPLLVRPQIMKIDTFERFLTVCREKKFSPKELIDQKVRLPYEQVGDWQAFIHARSTDISNWEIKLLSDAGKRFIEEFGV